MHNRKDASLFKLSHLNLFLMLLIFMFIAGDAISSEYNILVALSS
jgi:hypothetical protein